MTKFADLHIHTYYSDATLSPQDIIREALEQKISCISITDHDGIDGIGYVVQAAQGRDLEIIPGIELSSEVDGKDIHILGYFIDAHEQALTEALVEIQDVRIERIKKMVEKLKALGVDDLTAEEVFALSPSKAVGRPHLATVLMQKRAVSSVKEAFERYLAEDKPAYVKKMKKSVPEAIHLIRDAGGVAVLAHPMVSGTNDLIGQFVDAGLQGLEVFYPNCSKTIVEYYKNLAGKYNLVVTGGSDAHGDTKKNTFIGKVRVPYEYVEKLKDARRKS